MRVLEVGGRDAQRGGEVRAVADEEAGGVEVGEQPFVHVHVETVRSCKCGRQVGVLRQYQRSTSISGIDVDPGRVCRIRVFSGVGVDGQNGAEVVGGAGRGRAERGG